MLLPKGNQYTFFKKKLILNLKTNFISPCVIKKVMVLNPLDMPVHNSIIFGNFFVRVSNANKKCLVLMAVSPKKGQGNVN